MMTDDEIKKAVNYALRLLFWVWLAAFSFCLGGLVSSLIAEKPYDPECPPPMPQEFAQPFCQVMGSPVGGRMAQLPEGAGPHD